ncbi:MAG: hypothetical protein OEO84_13315 [Betaproteobacteria bacterium]|nr:hypothetical protein [Betaproteobacteria bacterium]
MKMKAAAKMLAVLSSVVLCASLAKAAPPSPAAKCIDMPTGTILALGTLCTDTENSLVGAIPPNDFKKQQDRDGLVGKVVAASFKMAQGKPCDAYQKLRDYETTLVLLMLTADSTKAKISELKGDVLQIDLVAAQAAIGPMACP